MKISNIGFIVLILSLSACGSNDKEWITSQDPTVQEILKSADQQAKKEAPKENVAIEERQPEKKKEFPLPTKVPPQELVRNYGDVLRSVMQAKGIKYNQEVMDALMDPRLSAVTTQFKKRELIYPSSHTNRPSSKPI